MLSLILFVAMLLLNVIRPEFLFVPLVLWGSILNCHFMIQCLLLLCPLIYIIHSDLLTFTILSFNGHHYYVFFLNDYSNYLWTFPISKKSQVYSIFLSFKAFIRTQFERDVKNLQCDNGWEFDNGPFQYFSTTNGLNFRFSRPQTSHKNGKPERKIKTTNNIVRTFPCPYIFGIMHSKWPHIFTMCSLLKSLGTNHQHKFFINVPILLSSNGF